MTFRRGGSKGRDAIASFSGTKGLSLVADLHSNEAAPSHTDTLFRLRLMGPMSAINDQGDVDLPRTRKARALLAILALAAPRPLLREHITSLLWSNRQREQGRASLRQCVHEVQDFLDGLGLPPLQTGRQQLKLESGLFWVDVQALSGATLAQPEALDLLQGELLEDLVGIDPAFDAWLVDETRRVRAGAAILAELVLKQQNAPDAIIAAAGRLVGIAPGHEAGWQHLIRAYGDSGNRPAALEAYEQCVQALALHSGTAPSRQTSALAGRLRTGDDTQMASEGVHSTASRSRGAVEARPDGVWVGVAVFRTTDPHDEATIAIGLSEEITNALARFRWINVLSPGSGVALAHEPDRNAEHWRSLDLDFLLDGTVQRSRAGDKQYVRVTVRLLDMQGGGERGAPEVIWSARFERDSADLVAMQDEIAAEIAAQVDPQMLLHESRRVVARQSEADEHETAYDMMLRAAPAIYRLVEPEYLEAGILLEKAARLAPNSATIIGWWAFWHAFLLGQGWAGVTQDAMQRAERLAERAVMLDPGCARAISIAAYVRSFLLHKDINETIGLHERALALNPNLPFAWVASALSHTFAGDHATAVTHALRARQLSPFDPHGFFFDSTLMVPSLMLRDYEAVVVAGRRSLALNPAMSATCKGLLSALGHMGRVAEAAEVKAKLLRIEPGFTLAKASARSALRRPEDLALYLDGLRRAGLPAG